MKINIKNHLSKILVLALIIISLILSIIFAFNKNYGKKRVFIFPSVEEGKYILETRYIKSIPEKSDIQVYCQELALGSGMERTKRIFSSGTKILSCIERNGIVYIDLSADIINMGDNVIEIKDGIDLMKENIMKNFKSVKEIKVFVAGKYAFD